MPTPTPKHYNRIYTRRLSPAEVMEKEVSIIMDPYRVAKTYGITGGAREQILKKVLRWTNKGHTEKQVLEEIIKAAQRNIQMIDEDAPIQPRGV